MLSTVRQNVNVRSRKYVRLTILTGKRFHDNKKLGFKDHHNCSYFSGELLNISVLCHKFEKIVDGS